MYTFTGINDLPSIAKVDRIAALGDPVLRNLQITQCYHELALAVATRTQPYANWCTFATWASKQAGQTIRKEDMKRALEHLLTTRPTTEQAATNVATATQEIAAQHDPAEIRQKVWKALNPMSAIDRASDAVARGNLKVFAEIGREFARFAAICLNDQTFDADHVAQYCADLRPGDPPDGQRLLRQAFMRYYQAFFENEPKTRAELMLLANLEIGLHEQTRLQPEIAESLEASLVNPDQFARRLLQALFSYRGWLLYVVLLFRRLLKRPMPLDLAIQRLLADARPLVRSLITEHMMVLTLPHGVWLRLGEDLNAEFPAALKQIASPDLLALLKQIDPTSDSLRETGAVDWADLPERLHFIADLFRCYAESSDLCESPFTPDQVATVKAGRIPQGSL
ncbi:hypothetical protein ANRL1_03453 [Anaerolineae bacterium]|nr:hypothetical protein ANRL1_03453 [Anaerolineae bacterium]